jgi:hypothetical protein
MSSRAHLRPDIFTDGPVNRDLVADTLQEFLDDGAQRYKFTGTLFLIKILLDKRGRFVYKRQ